MAGSQASGPGLFLRASFRDCHYCPYYFFPLSRAALNTTTKVKNAMHGFSWGGLVTLHLAMAGRGVLRTTSVPSSKVKYFSTVWTWFYDLKPNTYSCSWESQWKLLWFNHLLYCILSLNFYMSKRGEMWNLYKFLDILAKNKNKLLWKTHVMQNCFWTQYGAWVIAQIWTRNSLLSQILFQSKRKSLI